MATYAIGEKVYYWDRNGGGSRAVRVVGHTPRRIKIRYLDYKTNDFTGPTKAVDPRSLTKIKSS